MVKRHGRILPRIVVDGLFACDSTRLGCPDFANCYSDGTKKDAAVLPDRTVLVSVFPSELLSLTNTPKIDQIGPDLDANAVGQAIRLVRLATQAATPAELKELYEQGYLDAERWTHREERKQRKRWRLNRSKQRRKEGRVQS